jgi:signal transduction histidine kinase
MAKNSLNARELSGNQEVKNFMVLSGSIAHELKNYLNGISITAELSADNLKSIVKKVQEAAYLINNLQLQMRAIITGKVSAEDFRSYSLAKNIREALEKYPFPTEDERELIKLKVVKDFTYVGNPILTNHILYNLIKNSLWAIKNANKGNIEVTIISNSEGNHLIFRDTATGVAKSFLPKIFNLFASQTTAQGGSGIGLAFCKLVMNSYGGNISCQSVLGEYTEFTLEFPLTELTSDKENN